MVKDLEVRDSVVRIGGLRLESFVLGLMVYDLGVKI